MDIKETLVDRLTSRLFLISALVLAFETILVFTGDCTIELWNEMARWVLGIYAGGQGMSKLTKVLNK